MAYASFNRLVGRWPMGRGHVHLTKQTGQGRVYRNRYRRRTKWRKRFEPAFELRPYSRLAEVCACFQDAQNDSTHPSKLQDHPGQPERCLSPPTQTNCYDGHSDYSDSPPVVRRNRHPECPANYEPQPTQELRHKLPLANQSVGLFVGLFRQKRKRT